VLLLLLLLLLLLPFTVRNKATSQATPGTERQHSQDAR